jgi:hypothetical protein
LAEAGSGLPIRAEVTRWITEEVAAIPIAGIDATLRGPFAIDFLSAGFPSRRPGPSTNGHGHGKCREADDPGNIFLTKGIPVLARTTISAMI